ncbi:MULTISPECIES: DUF742 domain-containing protein [Streptomyces]|uniref:DUF742 domain-containing protein n=1 Tax=Streptomyces spororaveus TaxID=284039 RepID=A0ABQ3T844_9ACTN|nr:MULTISPECIES: DUF742 domain-containing protein [Streptomyces]MCM9082998.1 DUF742 domain-containing protein [Streptomyces spororaveus]MCX5302228.1 DUF742 domain-containing protein [Streptomyces sp. NBC_00160]GHI76568.1 hypothetical protein Sspor_21290 [Streptomyces spororaveus]
MRARGTGAYAKGRDTPWLDESAGRVMRPYTASGGRTRPGFALDLLSLVTATGARPHVPLGAEHTLVLRMCAGASTVTVAEVAGQLRLPAVVVKVLLSDLIEHGAVMAQAPRFPDGGSFAADDRSLLLAVLDGLRKRL